ncbi:Cytoglobin-2 [Acipenser ruthenus]|uniref:Cytoglobin-2 n=1 Tax=Acipenser ruthenus TaxID=7906 RepID=A0A444U084_ACIRT|nr:Cytoglobin-2 [Acipenser ruthenus]
MERRERVDQLTEAERVMIQHTWSKVYHQREDVGVSILIRDLLENHEQGKAEELSFEQAPVQTLPLVKHIVLWQEILTITRCLVDKSQNCRVSPWT